MFTSTKIIELGSCAFRQPQADSHCRFLHGYRLTAKFWFSAKHLDQNNWVVDFGGLKGLKKLMQDQFDHTTCISQTDPKLDVFKKLRDAGVCDLRVMDGVGIEKFAEYCHTVADSYVDELTDGRCKCSKVEVFEHENNSAIYTKPKNDLDIWSDLPPLQKQIKNVVESDKQFEKYNKEQVDRPTKGDSDTSELYPKRQKNKWIDPESTNVWGI